MFLTFRITMNTGNDAFQDHSAVADALRKLADRIERDEPTEDTLPIMDYNGNRVGSCEVESAE